MIRFALKGLAGRKLRAALTALAIVLGVAMVSGTYVLTDTIDKAFDTIFVESYAGTDAVVTGRAADISFQGDTAETPPFDESLLEAVQDVDEVEAATGSVMEETAVKLVGRDGKAIETMGAPSFGFGIDPSQQRFNPLDLKRGEWATGDGEVVIDAGTAEDEGYDVGDRIGVASLLPVEEFRIVGVAQFGGVDSIGSATFAVFELSTAQRLLQKEGKLDAISAAAEPGVTPEGLVRALDAALPDAVEVKTGVESAEEDSAEITEFTRFIRYFLLAFAGIALFVGAFVIFNTLSITVAQRTREFATLRTIGASRRQILTAVVLEALVVGLLASLAGLFLGLLLARGLNAVFVALELDLPQTTTVFATRTIVVSLAVGVIVTLLASLAPGIRATRVPPIAAVREGATLPPSRLGRFAPLIAAALIALAVALLAYGMFGSDVGVGDRLLTIAGGCLLLFAGVALISSKLVRPLAAVVGRPAVWVGGAAGALARGNAQRNPGRTAATAAALMIGIALVTFVAVLAEGIRRSNSDAIESQVRADYIVTPQDGFTPFVAGAGDAVERSPVVEVASDVRSDLAEVDGDGQYITGIEPTTITAVYEFDWAEGSDAVLADLGSRGAILSDDFAEDNDLAVGDVLTVRTATDRRYEVQVKAIYEPPPFYPILGGVSVAKETFDRLYERKRNQFTFVNVRGGLSPEAKASLEQAVEGFPDAKILTRQEWIDDQEEELALFLNLLYVLLALSVFISLFGMVNTLVLSVFERTRELGLLRAVGMTRRQVRRMIRHESVITALIGAALGLPLGIFLAALVTGALSQFGLQFAVPVGDLVTFTIVAVIAGILAAIAPARRAARLNVLEALQYE